MAIVPTCPLPREYQRLLGGALPAGAAEDLLKHLAECPRCADVISILAPGGGEATELVSDEAGRAAIVSRLRQHLGAETLGGGGTDRSDAPATRHGEHEHEHDAPARLDTADKVRTLFAPPREEGEMGWLGPYRILDVLGSGGMGVVLRAEDSSLRRPVAIKILQPELASAASAADRFLREAQMMAALKHDHVVTVYHVGEDRGVFFFTMELLEGESLDRRLRREQRLSLREVVRIGREVAVGLSAAHRRGLIHRDIKPANIWLEAETGRVKILDFGLARPVGATTMTQTGMVLGTPSYMAPEQARGGSVDHRSDLFSLGCVLYQLCTGRLPFSGPDVVSVLLSVVSDHPSPPHELTPDVSRPLSDLVQRLLAKRPDDRPQSAQEVVEALERLGGGPAPAPAPDPAEAKTVPAAAGRRPAARRGPARVGRPAAIAFVLFLAALGALCYLFGDRALLYAANKGAVVLDVGADDAVEVVARNEADREVVSSKPRVELPPGAYRIEVTVTSPSGEVRSFGREVTLARGAKEVLGVGRVPAVREARAMVHGGELYAVAISPDGKRVATGASDGTVKVWDAETGGKLFAIGEVRPDGSAAVHALAFSPDGIRLAGGTEDGAVRVWDAIAGKAARALPRQGARVAGVAFSPDGRYLAAACEQVVRVWDLGGAETPSLKGHTARVDSLCYAPAGPRLATGAHDGTAWVWDTTTGERTAAHRGHQHAVLAIAFGPDGDRVASADWDRVVRVWDASTGRAAFAVRGASHSIGFSPDGRWLAGGGYDQSLRVWDAATGQEVLFLRKAGHKVCFSPDGRHLVSGGTSGVLRLWDVTGLAPAPGAPDAP